MKLYKSKLVYLILYILMASITLSQEVENRNFQMEAKQYFEKTINRLGIPGFAVVVTQGDSTILAEGYGYADFENQLTANSNTNYYIASVTKSFTALLALIMNDAGILKLDDPLQKHFPDLKVESIPDLAKIKVRDLLTHTSGLENGPIGWRVAYSGVHDQSILLELMKYTKPNGAGYGNYEYTNVGYNIYAIILEKITGKSWQNWMQEKIFDPTGMNHTSAFISRAEKEHWLLARPYMVVDSVSRISLEKKDNTMQSAGGLIITPDDLAKWLKIQVEKGKLNGKQIFPESLIISSQQELINITESERLFKPAHYGFGWLHGEYESHKVIHHFGGFAGFSTHVSFMPDKKLGVAVMVNEAVAGNNLMHLIATFIYDYFFEKKDWPVYYDILNTFAEKLTETRKMISAAITKRNDLPWLLTMPFSEYSGSYQSYEYGILTIQESTSGLNVTVGNLQCVSTPFKNEDSIRVELIPGSGQVIEFHKVNNKISGLKYDGIYFTKIN
jgi:CubicO group peptidase (beta-lactamase class C family)